MAVVRRRVIIITRVRFPLDTKYSCSILIASIEPSTSIGKTFCTGLRLEPSNTSHSPGPLKALNPKPNPKPQNPKP